MLNLTKHLIYNPQDFEDFNQTPEWWEDEETDTARHEVLDFYRLVAKVFVEEIHSGNVEEAKRDLYAAWTQRNDDEEFNPEAFGGNIKEGETLWTVAYAKACDDVGLEMAFVQVTDTLCLYDNLGCNPRNELEELLF